ncbi:MAG: hypothetical protein IPK14_25255 [Blastocatellia bacterium]|nr:hypothetical protein [Blastocatellia bacterium]
MALILWINLTKGCNCTTNFTETRPSFPYPNVSSDAYQQRKKFHNILNVNVTVTSVIVGSTTYSFKANSFPVVRIQNLPITKVEPPHNGKDYDFELAYKLLPSGVPKRNPTFHKQGFPDIPVICPLTWFES